MTVKTRKATEPTPPPTFADIARKRISQHLTAYRGFVERAVAGEQLNEDDMMGVYDALERLHLPTFTFERDVQGVKDHARCAGKAADAQAREPEQRQRGRQVTEEIAKLTKQLNELRAEAHRLSVGGPLKLTAYLQRLNELKSLHPHVLLPLDKAVELRASALKVDVPPPEPANPGVMT
jgi:hypothetical protein